MNKKIILLIYTFSTVWFSCEKKLNITDFKDDFGYYKPELKIEGLLKQDDPTNSLIRIIKTSSITDPYIFNGKDDDNDGEIDEYDEVLPLIQDTTATVIITNLNSGEEFNFVYVADADSFLNWKTEDDINYQEEIVHYGGYKPESSDFHLDTLSKYKIMVDSDEFDQIITGETTVYPSVEFIDTLFNFNGDVVTMNIDDEKEIFWKSDLNVTAYYITYEEIIPDVESEYLYSFTTSRDNDLTRDYNNYSIGRVIIWGTDSEMILKITVEALSPDYGHYIFSSLPMNDPQRSNLRDESGKPVMGCFGATSAKSLYIKIVE